MSAKHAKRLVAESGYVAQVDMELVVSENGWSPALSVADAYRLDDDRAALRRGDVRAASRLARVFALTPAAW